MASASIAVEFPALFLDAASPRVVVGLETARPDDARGEVAVAWRTPEEEAGAAIFAATGELLREHGLRLADLRTVVFCEGPGSLLGIRLVAMALRVWLALPRETPLQVLGYRSLALFAADRMAEGQRPPFHVFTDARRESWNVLSVGARGQLGEIRRCSTNELTSFNGALLYPEEFPRWQTMPEGTQFVSYRPQRMPALAANFSLYHPVQTPDAFITELPAYRTWSATPSAS